MGKGKQKIDIKRIADKSKRRVTFTKRRQGLFKKVLELDTLCGSCTSIVSVSDAGTVFTAGSIHPSLIHQLLSSHSLMGLEMLGLEELGTVLANLKKAQESVELLLRKKEEEEEVAAAAAGFSSKEYPTFADGAAMTSSSGVSSLGSSDFEGSIFRFAEIEDILMGEDVCSDFGEFDTRYSELEHLLMGGDGFDEGVGGPSSSSSSAVGL